MLPDRLRDDEITLLNLDDSAVRGLCTYMPEFASRRDNRRDGIAFIHLAAYHGREAILEALLEAGADIDLRSGVPSGDLDLCGQTLYEPGWTPLMFASRVGKFSTTSLLLSHGADATIQDSAGFTALHAAAITGGQELIAEIVKAKPPLDHWSHCRYFDEETLGWYCAGTPLHVAAANDNAGAVRQLLEAGADINASWLDKRTPLFYAAATGSAKALEELLKFGANPNQTESHTVYSVTTHATPLHLAARSGALECVTQLLDAGAARNTIEPYTNGRARDWAMQAGHGKIAKLLENK